MKPLGSPSVSLLRARRLGTLLCLLVSNLSGQANAQQTCTMTDIQDTKYPDSATKDTAFGNLEECKTECLQRDNCVATESRSGFCFLYTSIETQFSNTGSVLSVKTCETETTTSTPAPCTYQELVSTDSIPVALQVKLSLAVCEAVCKQIAECQAFSFGSSTCSLFSTTSVTFTASPGGNLGIRKNCEGESDRMCCFAQTSDLSVTSSSLFDIEESQASCESLCSAMGACKAISFLEGNCNIYTERTPEQGGSGQTFRVKTCSDSGTLSLTETCKGFALQPCIYLLTLLCGIRWLLL